MGLIVVIPYTFDGINILYKPCNNMRESDNFICNVLDKGGDILNDRAIKSINSN